MKKMLLLALSMILIPFYTQCNSEVSELYGFWKHLLSQDSQILQIAASTEKLSSGSAGSFEHLFCAAKVIVNSKQKTVSVYEIISPITSRVHPQTIPTYVFSFDEMIKIKDYINFKNSGNCAKK